jgi:hypothetical protein
MTNFSGGCLCGDVRYEGSNSQGGGHCYCEDCRRSSGTSHCSHMIVAESDVQVKGDMRFFDKAADSGNNVSRGFCLNCGSAVLSTNSGMPGMVFVRASSLDDPNQFEPGMIVYAGRAPDWSESLDALPRFPGMPGQSDVPEMEA